MTRGRFVLGIDTASRLGSIALSENGRTLASEPLPPGGHSSGLSAAGEKLLTGRAIGWNDLAGVAVSEGPGSFTGLRIGLAWAKGICFGSDIRLLLVSAHEASAYAHREDKGWIATVLQGERGEAEAVLWSADGKLSRHWGPRSVPERDLPSALLDAAGRREAHSSIAVAAPELRSEIAEILRRQGFRLVDADIAAPRGAAVAELGDAKLLAGEAADVVTSAPAYGRAPNARKPAP